MRQLRRHAMIALLLAAIGTAALLLFGEIRSQAASVVPAFTVHYIERAANYANGQSHETNGTFARRKDGSTALTSTLYGPNGAVHVTRTITLVPEGQSIQVSDSAKVRTTMNFNGASRNAPPTVGTDCGATPGRTVLGYGEFHGAKVVKLVHDAENRRLETWNAPALGCYVVRQRMDFRGPDGKVTDYSERWATSITAGEPAPEAFQVPADYREVQPSDFTKAVLAHFGKECTNCGSDEKLKRRDDLYARQHRP